MQPWLIIWIGLWIQVPALAQFILTEAEPSDSLVVPYVYDAFPNDWHIEVDTGLHQFQQFDPVRRLPEPALHLGTLGTAYRYVFYKPTWRRGWQSGITAYEVYRISLDSLRFYDAPKAYSNAYFSQAATQGDSYFKGTLARNFGKQVRFTIHYRRLNQTGLQSDYKAADLLAQNTSLATGFWYLSPRKTYQASLSFKYDVIRQRHNGGITSDSLLGEPRFPGLFSLPVFLTDAQSRHDHRGLRFQQHFFFNQLQKKDSTQTRAVYISHRIDYNLHRYLYRDFFLQPIGRDSTVYQSLITDGRGLRHFLKIQELSNHLRVGYDLGKQQHIEAGLWHGMYFIDDDIRVSRPHSLYATGRMRLQLQDWIKLQADAEVAVLGEQVGDFRINGDIGTSLAGNPLTASLSIRSLSPSIRDNRMPITQRWAWRNDFDKQLSTSLCGTFFMPSLRLRAHAQSHLISNFLYYDEQALPQQHTSALNVLQLGLEHRFRIWRFHLHNAGFYQVTNEPGLLPAPRYFTQHSLFYDGYWFKNRFHIRIGGDLRLADDYFPPSFMPVAAYYYLQNQKSQSLFPIVDAYASFQVKSFRFFFKTENLGSAIQEKLYNVADHYPLFAGNTRFGISWLFRE